MLGKAEYIKFILRSVCEERIKTFFIEKIAKKEEEVIKAKTEKLEIKTKGSIDLEALNAKTKPGKKGKKAKVQTSHSWNPLKNHSVDYTMRDIK